jgi:hypothetical protein
LTGQYPFNHKDLIVQTLWELLPPGWFWTLAIGYGTFLPRILAGLKRNYESASNFILSDSSWYYLNRPAPQMLAEWRDACR